MKDIALILDNIRSALNVGAITRTAAGLGIKRIYAVGITPYPKVKDDSRLPHVAERAHMQITKTSLGAERVVTITPINDVLKLAGKLKEDGYELVAIENTKDAEPLPDYHGGSSKAALILGHEIDGVSQSLLKNSDEVLSIPMNEGKESFNVSAAAAMAMYHFRFKA